MFFREENLIRLKAQLYGEQDRPAMNPTADCDGRHQVFEDENQLLVIQLT